MGGWHWYDVPVSLTACPPVLVRNHALSLTLSCAAEAFLLASAIPESLRQYASRATSGLDQSECIDDCPHSVANQQLLMVQICNGAIDAIFEPPRKILAMRVHLSHVFGEPVQGVGDAV